MTEKYEVIVQSEQVTRDDVEKLLARGGLKPEAFEVQKAESEAPAGD